ALARWRRLGHADLAVSVNVSAIQFRLDDISAVVSAALGEVGESQSPDRLELELTETLMIGDRDEDLEVLVRLSRNGIPLAMDDFGTGYSSLSYLVKMPFQVVKIDRQFIQRMCAEEQVYRVVQAIIAMSHALNMRVVAEGVETHEQQHALRALGCDELQGYLLSRPLSEQSFLELVSELRNGKPVDDATQGGLRVELAHAARPVEDSSAVTRMLDAGATRVGAAGSS
ncbi:MAG: EAL domain-containing protein, partial [Gammaproteobacteria bacterium]|nr:EAL domain-containing protein [Gammaproteobacteria bacterium]